MNAKKWFLPVGLVLAISAALVFPGPGVALRQANMVAVFVMTIFLVNGWEFKLSETRLRGHFFVAFAASAAISLLLGPLIGLAAVKLYHLDPLLAVGLIVMSASPVTLSSAIVMTDISGGNRAWALIMTIGLNLLAILSMPFMVKLTLSTASDVNISAPALLLKLVQLVLIPFLIGFVLRRLLSRFIGTITFLSLVPSACVVLTIYAVFSASRGLLLQMPPHTYLLTGGSALSVHLILLLLALSGAWILRLHRPEQKAFLFITSQKTMPMAISVLAVIATDNALALVPCLLFHFIQLFLDSFIASHLAPRINTR